MVTDTPLPQAAAMPLVAIIGPSGCGKSSVVRELVHRHGAVVHPTWTTRPRRRDELDGCVEHRFVSDETFDALETDGFFVETATPFGLSWRYGLPAVLDGGPARLDVLMLRAPFVERMRQLLPISLVVQIEDDPHRVTDRLIRRGGAPDELIARMTDNEAEAVLGRSVADRTLVNDSSIADLAERLVAQAMPMGSVV
jgi:guanylate kinase